MPWTWKVQTGWTVNCQDFFLGGGKESLHHHAQSRASTSLFMLLPRAVSVPGMPFLLSATILCFSANLFSCGSTAPWFGKGEAVLDRAARR